MAHLKNTNWLSTTLIVLALGRSTAEVFLSFFLLCRELGHNLKATFMWREKTKDLGFNWGKMFFRKLE